MILDFRERGLIERLPDAQVKNLTLGDIVLEVDGVERVIVERKTGADLSASICDGRYREQSDRLSTCGLAPRDIVYVIEGSLDGHTLPKQNLIGAIISLSHRLGFTVMRTDSIDDTVEFLKTLETKLDAPSTPTTVTKRAKKDSITVDNIAALMLSQIPSVSVSTASALLNGRSIADFTLALRDDPSMLGSVTINKRKVSKKTIEAIKTFLKC